MKSTHEILRERLHQRAGLVPPPPPRFNLEYLELTQWSSEFERLMRNRLIMGALRYGTIADNRGRIYARCADALKRIRRYQATGNLEYLVDAANLLLLEYECGSHPTRHFTAVDDGPHCPTSDPYRPSPNA